MWFEQHRIIRLSTHGYLAALLPLITIHLSFLVSMYQGYIEWCNPYWSDCVSISKTGRSGLAYWLFKGLMIPALLLLGLFWHRCAHWPPQGRLNPDRWLPRLGWIASASLFAYTIALGHSGDHMQLLRRFSVVLFIGLTFISQVMMCQRIKQPGNSDAALKLLTFSLVILAIAILSLTLDYWMGPEYDRIENAFEWWLILLLITHLAAMSHGIAKEYKYSV